MPLATDCPFCKANWPGLDIIDRNQTGSIVAVTPLDPVVPGHVLIIHGQHRDNAAQDPDQAGFLMNFASKYVRARGIEANLIASVGSSASQTIQHSCVHVIPRRPGDGLALPWTSQHKTNKTKTAEAHA